MSEISTLRAALFISGGGSTMAAIIRAVQTGEIPNTEIACIISDNPSAGGLAKAAGLGVPPEHILVVNPRTYANHGTWGSRLLAELEERAVNFIGLYGFLKLLPRVVVQRYHERSVNQHPGPEEFGGSGMYGLRVHSAVLAFARRINREGFHSEVVAMRVHENYDQGAVLGRKLVDILPEDKPEQLAARALPLEHQLQIEVLRQFALRDVREQPRDPANPLIHPNERWILEEVIRLETFSPKGQPK